MYAGMNTARPIGSATAEPHGLPNTKWDASATGAYTAAPTQSPAKKRNHGRPLQPRSAPPLRGCPPVMPTDSPEASKRARPQLTKDPGRPCQPARYRPVGGLPA